MSLSPADATSADVPISYPRQEAVTRRFRLGAPRAFTVAPDGRRVAFIRSAGGRDPVGSLWVAEADGSGALVERLVVDARALVRDDGDLPAAEKSRRERMRETTAGITAYSSDDATSMAAFSLDGVPFVVDLSEPGSTPVELPHPGPVVDPRLSPDAAWMAFVSDRSLYVVASDGRTAARLLCAAETDTQSWGLADFVAAEELDRYRGLWWLAGGQAVLAELVDEAPVAVRWIADPADPAREPVAHRYPAAGTDNPVARLFRVPLDGAVTEVALGSRVVPVPRHRRARRVRGRRRQRAQPRPAPPAHPRLDPTGSVTVARERVSETWITMQGGVPCRASDGALLEIVANSPTTASSSSPTTGRSPRPDSR